MKYIPILLLWLVSGLCAGCSDFFEESSQNLFYVTDVADLDELLVGECYISTEGFEATSYSSSKLLMSKSVKTNTCMCSPLLGLLLLRAVC